MPLLAGGVAIAMALMTATPRADTGLWFGWLGKLDRVGVGPVFGFDSGRLSGSESINQFTNDESFNFNTLGPEASAYLLFKKNRYLRWGPEARYVGNYATSSGNAFTFGVLTELSAMAEFNLHVIEEVDAIFVGRAGLAVLFPGGDFKAEITRLQADGAHVWNVPRPGVFGEVQVGVRRPIIGALAGRLVAFGELEHLFLFDDNENVNGYRFQKTWGVDTRRLGAMLGLEVAF